MGVAPAPPAWSANELGLRVVPTAKNYAPTMGTALTCSRLDVRRQNMPANSCAPVKEGRRDVPAAGAPRWVHFTISPIVGFADGRVACRLATRRRFAGRFVRRRSLDSSVRATAKAAESPPRPWIKISCLSLSSPNQ